MSFRHRIRSGEKLIGTLVTLPSPEIVEILVECGFDWLFIDLEHSVISVREAQMLLQATRGQTPCLVRTENKEETAIRKALDIGAQGIIVPQVNSAKEAARIVSFARYPPAGSRSVGLGRAQRYGLKLNEYLDNANDSLAVVIQIEHIDGVKDLQNILEVPGIDAVFIGPYDLSGSLGKLGMVNDPEVQKAIESILFESATRGVPVGSFAATAEAAAALLTRGVSLLAVSTDALLLGRAGRSALSLIKGQKDSG